MVEVDDWFALTDRLYAKGADLFNGADPPLTEAGPRNPKIVALTLLARTLGNMKAAVLLLQGGLLIEARTIVRCVYENFFFSAALAKRGATFIEALERDDITNRKKRAAGLLDWSQRRGEKAIFHDTLAAFRDSLIQEHGKTDTIILQQAAQSGDVGDAFAFYRELSSDAAHPSAASLSRHISVGDAPKAAPFTLHAEALVAPGEEIETLELLCSAVLGVLVAVNEIVGGDARGERLGGLAAEHRKLSDAGKAARDAVSNSSTN